MFISKKDRELVLGCIFVVKQKTAYDMRISDWSSDVCSSDLGMTTDEIQEAQRPYAGWGRETRAFSSNATSPPPRWQDFTDPIDAIGARFQERMREADRKSVVEGKSVSVRVDPGGRRIIKKTIR